MDQLLEDQKLLKIHQDKIHNLKTSIVITKIEFVIKISWKIPGPDVFTKEYYWIFKELILVLPENKKSSEDFSVWGQYYTDAPDKEFMEKRKLRIGIPHEYRQKS